MTSCRRAALSALAALGAACCASAAANWTAADAVISAAIAAHVFPGAAAGVLTGDGRIVYAKGFGRQVYPGELAPLGGNAAVSADISLFDMASITKIVGATTASALLVERGLLDLDMLVADASLLGPAFAGQGKQSIRVRDLLLHQAGFPPDPVPGYSAVAFACPATAQQPHPPLAFSCSEQIFAAVLAQPLQSAPRSAYCYSDLSFITLQMVLGTLIAAHALVPPSALLPACAAADPARAPGLLRVCHFEAFVRTEVLAAAGMRGAGFLPAPARWPDAMPTYADPVWRHQIMQGAVSDENSYALGGISGHAGIFATLTDMLAFARLWALRSPPVISAATRALFFTVANESLSSRALGWDTQAANDDYRDCGDWPDATVYHTGYTGTLICINPLTNVSLVLLTTRVYPNKIFNDDAIQTVRQNFASAVQAALAEAAAAA